MKFTTLNAAAFERVLVPKKILLIMKLTTLLIVITLLQVSAAGYSQRVTLNEKNAPLEKVIQIIKKQTGYVFIYDNPELKKTNVSVWVNNVSVEEALEKSLKNLPFTFKIIDNNILIKHKQIAVPHIEHAKLPVIVSGKVTDVKGEPLPGVSVKLKGGTIGVTTGADGSYTLTIQDNGILVFSFIGFLPQEITTQGRTSINVVLSEQAQSLSEMVVVGYGTQKKVNLTGAVSAISSEELESRPVTAISSGLQGLLPGVTVRSSTGLPGQNGGSIRIRGIGTLGDPNPLIVIDGIPGGTMDILNPDDIASISVLKDAASSSIYGVRGANGVILVTTKKGRADSKPTVAYNNYFGTQSPTALPEFLGSPDYMALLNEAQINVGRTPTYTDTEIEIARNGSDPDRYGNTNWMKEIYKKNAAQQSHNISVNGGANNTSYYISYGYLKQNGLITGDNYGSKRNNVRLRLNTKLIDRVDVDANIGYIDRAHKESSEGLDGASGPLYASHQIIPLVPLKFSNGSWGYLGGSRNPVAVATDGGANDFSSQELTGNLGLTLNLAEGLKLRGQYGLVKSNSQREIFNKLINYISPVTNEIIYQTNFPNKLDNRDYFNTYQTVIGIAEYAKVFNKHDFNVLAGASQESNIGESFTASRTGLVSQDVGNINLGTANQLNTGSADQTALQSLFGRLTYSFSQKYLAEINLRYDGSSRFARGVRWNLFPSASVGWRLSEEKFFGKLKTVFEEAKIRASYGQLGNDKVGTNYAYGATIVPVTTMPIGNAITPGYAQNVIPNPILTWENVIKQNIGLDLLMFKGRLGITADYFVHDTDDILLRVTYPDVLGATEPSQNAGKVQNKGWELAMNWKDQIGDFTYGINANISDVKNKVTSLGGVPPAIGNQVRFLGQPIDAFYGLVATRLAQESDFDYNATTKVYTPKFPFITGDQVKPGDVMYQDLNGDGKLTLADDRKVIGNPFPRYTYSFRGDVGWKGIDLTVYFQGVGKADGFIDGAARHAYITESANPQKFHLDRWTPQNTDAVYPRFTYQLAHNQRLSTKWLENASYLRLKNVQIGYTLPARYTDKYRISRFRLFASGDNLFTSTKFFSSYDPETPVSSGGFYPQVKTFIMGLNFSIQ